MNEKIICEKCGADMQTIDPCRPVGLKCPKCGWGWVTSYIEPIKEDSTDYTVILLAVDNASSKDVVKTIAGIAGIGFIQAKKMIENTPTNLFVGKAIAVKGIIATLDALAINYRVEPELPY